MNIPKEIDHFPLRIGKYTQISHQSHIQRHIFTTSLAPSSSSVFKASSSARKPHETTLGYRFMC